MDLITSTEYTVPTEWSIELRSFVAALLCVNEHKRVHTLASMRAHAYMCRVKFDDVLRKRTAPVFEPSQDSLNCDPTYELEEVICESKPIHDKNKRLAAMVSVSAKGVHYYRISAFRTAAAVYTNT